MAREHTLYDFNSFTFIDVCPVVQDILVNVPCALKKYSLFLLDRVLYNCQLDPLVLLSFSICFMIFCLVVLSITKREVRVSNYDCGFLFSVHLVLVSHILQLCCLVHIRLGHCPSVGSNLY